MTDPMTKLYAAYRQHPVEKPTPVQFMYWLHGAFELRGAYQGDPRSYQPYLDTCPQHGCKLQSPFSLMTAYARIRQQYQDIPQFSPKDQMLSPILDWLFRAFTFNGNILPDTSTDTTLRNSFVELGEHFQRIKAWDTIIPAINDYFEPHALTLDELSQVPPEKRMPKDAFFWWLAGYGDLFGNDPTCWSPPVTHVIQLHAYSAGLTYIPEPSGPGFVTDTPTLT